jgi:hypothetical protein
VVLDPLTDVSVQLELAALAEPNDPEPSLTRPTGPDGLDGLADTSFTFATHGVSGVFTTGVLVGQVSVVIVLFLAAAPPPPPPPPPPPFPLLQVGGQIEVTTRTASLPFSLPNVAVTVFVPVVLGAL